jgi:hypothetical protein
MSSVEEIYIFCLRRGTSFELLVGADDRLSCQRLCKVLLGDLRRDENDNLWFSCRNYLGGQTFENQLKKAVGRISFLRQLQKNYHTISNARSLTEKEEDDLDRVRQYLALKKPLLTGDLDNF